MCHLDGLISSNCGFTLEIPPGVAGSPARGGTQRGSPPPAGRGVQPHPPPKTGIAHGFTGVGGSGASLLRSGAAASPQPFAPPPPPAPGFFFFFWLRSLVLGEKARCEWRRGQRESGTSPGRPPRHRIPTATLPLRSRRGLQLLFRAFPLSPRVVLSASERAPSARAGEGGKRAGSSRGPPGWGG